MSDSWSLAKKDAAPRGVRRHESGVWGIRYTCGAGHLHKEKVGPLKGDAIRAYHDRRARAQDEPGWCPAVERGQARAAATKAKARSTFREYAKDYLEWAEPRKRSWKKDRARLSRPLAVFGDRKLDEITTPDVERFLDSLSVSGATSNRHRDLLSAMFKRALRLGLVAKNPVTGIPKAKEAGGRITYLPPASPGRPAFEEDALRDALPPDLRPLFAVSVHTGLRWSEEIALEWRDVDMLAGSIGVGRSKNGYSRRVPMNSTVRRVLVEVGSQRARPNDPAERIFTVAYRTAARAFARSVARAQAALQDAGRDASRLDGYTWHGNRHTFASRLVMAGVDLLTVKELGGWRTLAMVQRYAHLAPAHLASAVERLVAPEPAPLASNNAPIEVPAGTVSGQF
jgi:site-specific recombinase XerD